MAIRILTSKNEARLRAEIARLGWEAAEETVVENASECIALLEIEPFGGDAPLGASRYGGVPDLPPGELWPQNEDGRFLNFLMQVNLAEAVPPPVGVPLPTYGQLYCFSDYDDYTDAIGVRAFYHDVDSATLVRAALPPDDPLTRASETFKVSNPYRLAARTVIDLPRWTSDGETAITKALFAVVGKQIDSDADRYDAVDKAYREFNDSLLGSSGAEIAGSLCAQPHGIGYMDDDAFAVALPGDGGDWVLLWTLYSSTPADVCFYDVGYLHIYVKRSALARLDFSELRARLWT